MFQTISQHSFVVKPQTKKLELRYHKTFNDNFFFRCQVSRSNPNMEESSKMKSPSKPSSGTLLSLPRELRDNILLYAVINDLFTFSTTTQRPACLFVSHQLREEYSDVLFNKTRGQLIKLDAYNGLTRSWSEITDQNVKRETFLHCEIAVPLFASSNTPLGLLEFMGGAKRVCGELWRSHGEGVRMGILTICTAKTAVRRWHWSIAEEGARGEKGLM